MWLRACALFSRQDAFRADESGDEDLSYESPDSGDELEAAAASAAKREKCAICKQPEEPGVEGRELWQVCACTVAHAHRDCLEANLKRSGVERCPNCGYRYKLRWQASYTLGRSIWVWLRKHADTKEVALVAFLAVLMVAEVLLVEAYLRRVTQYIRTAPVDGYARDYRTNLGEYWRFVRDSWAQFFRHLDLPPSFLGLAAAVLAAQAAHLAPSAATSVASFRDWYGRTFILRLAEEPHAA